MARARRLGGEVNCRISGSSSSGAYCCYTAALYTQARHINYRRPPTGWAGLYRRSTVSVIGSDVRIATLAALATIALL